MCTLGTSGDGWSLEGISVRWGVDCKGCFFGIFVWFATV